MNRGICGGSKIKENERGPRQCQVVEGIYLNGSMHDKDFSLSGGIA
jgi:hypothetical protein